MYFQFFRESATISIFSFNEFILTPAATWIGEVDQIRNSIQMENQGINVVKKRKQLPVHFYTFISFVFIPPQLLWFWFFFYSRKLKDGIEGEKADEGQEVVIEEENEVIAGSEEMEMNINRILEKVERFTQQVSLSLTCYGDALDGPHAYVRSIKFLNPN